MKKISFLFFLILSVGLISLSTAHAVVIISTVIPGSTTATIGSGGPGAFIANFYQFALIIGGVLAFGVIVYGGVRYMTSAGNPSGQSEAKEWIEGALLGLLLLAGAYLILSVVNPQLLNLNLPELTPVTVQTTAPSNTSYAPGPNCTGAIGIGNGSCPVNDVCDPTSHTCQPVPAGTTPCGGNNNGSCPDPGETCVNTNGAHACAWSCTVNNNGTGSCPSGRSCTPKNGGYYCV